MIRTCLNTTLEGSGHRAVRRAFTLLELMITVTIIAIVASVVVPMLKDDNRVRVIAAAGLISSDLELAQVMTISYPKDPVVVRFDPENHVYWLAFASDPETPIARNDTGQPYRVVLGESRAITAQGVNFELKDVADNMIQFNAQGGLMEFTSAPEIVLTRGDSSISLGIAASTGTITQVDSGAD